MAANAEDPILLYWARWWVGDYLGEMYFQVCMACSLGGGSPSTPNTGEGSPSSNPPMNDPGMEMDNGKTSQKDSSVVTLDPYTPNYGPKNTVDEKRKKQNMAWKKLTLEELLSPSKWSQYITFVGNEQEDIPSDFVIYRSLKSILNTENVNFSVDRNKITVKAETESQSNLLLTIRKIGNKEFIPTDKTQYNCRSGTMLLDRLRLGKDESNYFIAEGIKEILTDQHHKVNDVQIYEKTSFRTTENIKIARIVFGQQTIPSFMKVGNKKIQIREELPRPFHCRKCLKFGHTKKYCKDETALCYTCGQQYHGESCDKPLSCFNCGDTHHAFSWDCRFFKYHQKVLIRSLRYGISIRDAKQDLREEGISLSNPSYSSIARTSQTNQEHQTVPTSNRFSSLNETDESSDASESNTSETYEGASVRPKKQRSSKKSKQSKSMETDLESQLKEICGTPLQTKRVLSPDTSSVNPLLDNPPSKKYQKKVSPNSSQETIVFEEKKNPPKTSTPSQQPEVKKPSLKKPLSLIHDYPMPKPLKDDKENGKKYTKRKKKPSKKK